MEGRMQVTPGDAMQSPEAEFEFRQFTDFSPYGIVWKEKKAII
jgi:hypothetical protein